MADSACLMHAFSYASAVPNEAKQGNPMHALGESISFGRFMSESLAWEKWSTFSHNKYVEEAERYARPGSVAQKKAFFEAHYKRIAAKKAAALLQQPNDSGQNQNDHAGDEAVENIHNEDPPNNDEHSSVTVGGDEDCKPETEQVNLKAEEAKALPRVEAQETASGSELSETPQMERPLLKNSCSTKEDDEDEVSSAPPPPIKKRSALSSLKTSIHGKTSRIPSTPAMPYTYPHLNKENMITPIAPIMKSYGAVSIGVTKPTSKSLSSLLNLTPAAKEPDIAPPLAKETSQVAPISTKNCPTPLMTPMATSNGLSKLYSATPATENGRTKTPVNPLPSGSKTSAPKWHLLTSVCSKSLTACRNKLQSPNLSTTPFRLRTEERAARRKQKLEEKFNAKEEEEEVHKVHLQTKLKEKAGTELRKLGRSLCFKARPLPDFYKERETTKNQSAKENPVIHPQPLKLGKKTSSTRLPATKSSSGAFKNAAKTNDKRPTVSVTSPRSLA
ncbi:PREDICTED: protein WVD2-like 7 isoform X2 [Ipomoea nil]|uniref:protein WVD2-like 7 isoform X2 n=1 Tax=Ipomoea nil TaxID=35883 RepID=UPI000901B346|nr:PREDICTED: protein WVD2-like 7 isoform X2 [Ipomoea nil]